MQSTLTNKLPVLAVVSFLPHRTQAMLADRWNHLAYEQALLWGERACLQARNHSSCTGCLKSTHRILQGTVLHELKD